MFLGLILLSISRVPCNTETTMDEVVFLPYEFRGSPKQLAQFFAEDGAMTPSRPSSVDSFILTFKQ